MGRRSNATRGIVSGKAGTAMPDPDDEERKGEVTRDGRHETRIKKVKEQLKKDGYRQKGKDWFNDRGERANEDKLHGDHYHKFDRQGNRTNVYLEGDSRRVLIKK